MVLKCINHVLMSTWLRFLSHLKISVEGFFDEIGYPNIGRGPPDGIFVSLLKGVERIGDEKGAEERDEKNQEDRHQLDQGRGAGDLAFLEMEPRVRKATWSKMSQKHVLEKSGGQTLNLVFSINNMW